jgi:hypothetical protein
MSIYRLSSININSLCPFFISISAWLMLSPYMVWGNKFAYIVAFALIVISFSCWSLVDNVLEKERIIVSAIIFFNVFVYFLLLGASVGWAVIEATGAGILFLIQKRLGKDVLHAFKLIFLLSLIPGMVIWCWHLFGLPLTIWHLGYIDDTIVPNQLKVEAGQHYYKYIGSVILDYMIDSNRPIFRMCAMYDEPGVVGTLAALLLAADQFNLSKHENKLLFAGGLMSFSLAFFILAIAALLVFRRWKYSLVLLIVGSLIFILSPVSLKESISAYSVSRFKLESSKNFLGNNRESSFSRKNFNQWLQGDTKQFVMGIQTVSDEGSTWKSIFIKTGMIGALLFVVSLLGFLFSMPLTYYSLVFFLIFFLSIYQRPDALHFPILLVLVCGVANLSKLSIRRGRVIHNVT